MIYSSVRDRLPPFLRAHLLHFETAIESAVAAFAGSLADGARVLDAGAGEAVHQRYFARQRYVAVDLGVGDREWNYARLDAVADLSALPFRDGAFDGCLNVVTLEHVREPRLVLGEIGRSLRPGAALLLIAPLEWEVHQSPHDYFRYTRHALEWMLAEAGFVEVRITPAGGFFRLLSRRLLNALQFFPGLWFVVAAVFFVPPALVLPALDGLDRGRDFTLGYICTARKRS